MGKFTPNIVVLAVALFLTLGINSSAKAEGVPWNDHQEPFNFLFGNPIETHQSTIPILEGRLPGFLYITFTGEYTAKGEPIFRHSTTTDPENEVSVGWQVRVVPTVATVVYNQVGVQPIWLIKDRNDLPQPSGFRHFRWLDGPMNAMDLNVGDAYGGYILEIMAKDTFILRHDSELVRIANGLDLATHTNVVTSFPGFTAGGDTDGKHE